MIDNGGVDGVVDDSVDVVGVVCVVAHDVDVVGDGVVDDVVIDVGVADVVVRCSQNIVDTDVAF